MRRLAVRAFLIGLCVSFVGAAGAAYWGWNAFTGAGPLTDRQTLIIEKGTGIRALSRQLVDAGIVGDANVFMAGSRVLELDRRFRAGEFAFKPGMSMRAVAEHLVTGEMLLRRLTIPEGLLSVDIVGLIDRTEGLTGAIASVPANGALLPETYFYAYGEPRSELLDRMKSAMRRALDEIWRDRDENIAITTPEEARILASIIERETGVGAERPRVSAVFHNRLRRGMRLQSDPTVAYAVTGGKSVLARPLSRADLKLSSPYNTYESKGLPPGPIANPGRAALVAAVKPLTTKEYYFVADGNGGHAFARTLREHNRNVAKWRRLQRLRKTPG